jgi:arylformamidase
VRIVDLTMPLGSDTPVWPGDPRVEVAAVATLGSHGYASHAIRLGSHNGTHLDAPAHMIPGGRRLGAYPADRFVGPGRLVDLDGGWRAQAAGIRPGEVVLLHAAGPEPAIPAELVDLLVAGRAGMVGIDAASVDSEPFPVHKRLLGSDVLIIENLVNLERLRGHAFQVVALPLALDLEGSPARVIARLRGGPDCGGASPPASPPER